MAKKTTKRPRDLNRLAASIVKDATTDLLDAPAKIAESSDRRKNPHAVALGILGGRKGGPARAAALSAERRSEIARKAAQARWAFKDKP